ncbi:MAG: (2Fe-2S)-binding protein [Planctomycetes bacterium]|nr:(2Fe-2S)-binding protein [Planctomycetota bacterium]
MSAEPAAVSVRFEPSGSTVLVPAGTTLLQASERAGVEIVTGCRRGMCGTDPVRILAGLEHLARPQEHETGTLERMGLDPSYRLSCSARVEGGPVVVLVGAF